MDDEIMAWRFRRDILRVRFERNAVTITRAFALAHLGGVPMTLRGDDRLPSNPSELAVYARAGAEIRDVYAVKGALGHGLGAAALAAMIIACLCAAVRERPPMPWITEPVETTLPVVADSPAVAAIDTHAVFAAGFGGHVGGAVIRST